jgi:hypothetical protein
MAVSSLTRFTVPLGGNQSASTQGLLMPKLKFRFRALFDNFGVSNPKTELTKQVITFARPSVTMEPIEIPIYNSRIYLAGRPSWSTSAITLRDDAGGNVSRLVGEQLQKQYDFLEQASASSAIDYKFQTVLEVLDGANGATEPTVLEAWRLEGCFLSEVNYQDMDYGSNEPVTIQMTLRYDNALQTTGGGVGTTGLTQFNPASSITG